MLKYKEKKMGYTLIELIISIAFVSIIIVITTNLFLLGNKSHTMAVKEYDLQSSVRIATEEINKITRYSKAVFAVPQTYVAEGAMDPDWNYFMVSPDKKRVVSMEYNSVSNRFEENILVPEQSNIEYELYFEKVEDATLGSLMRYLIKAFVVDEAGNRSEKEKVVFESTVESINAPQVIDRGTGIPVGGVVTQSTSLALAYRNDGQSSGKGNEYAYITIVVDVSGSMRLLPTDIDANVDVPNREKKGSRMQKVRDVLVGRGSEEGIIKQFANEENVFVSLVPFSTTANYPSTTSNNSTYNNARHPIYDVYNNLVYTKNSGSQHKDTLLEEVANKLKANGGTNTGDGLRRAYQLHLDFRNRMSSIVKENEKVHHYMILLVDGQSTYETTSKAAWEDKGKYVEDGTYSIGGQTYPKYLWDVNYMPKLNGTIYYETDGNVTTNTKYPSATRPKNSSNYTTDGNTRYYGVARDDTTTSNGLAITGSGNTFVGAGYINKIGNSIKSFNSNKGIKSYVIGYATGLTERVKEIGNGIGTDSSKVYSYDNPDFDLQEVFESIANDILADYWVIVGPEIQN